MKRKTPVKCVGNVKLVHTHCTLSPGFGSVFRFRQYNPENQ